MTARYIALDLEATSINPLLAVPLEVAAVEIRESGKYEDRGTEPRSVYVVPHIEHEDLLAAEYGALRVSRYFERGLAERRSCESDTYDAARRLAELLDGAHIVAANPHYDATVLARWFDRLGLEPRWQFRLVDVEVLTMLAHNLPTPPSLRESALRWGVDYDPNKAHSAMYDAELAAAVFTEARVWGAMMDTPASDQAGADAA